MSTLDTSFGGGAGPGPQLSGGAWSANLNNSSHNSMGLSQAAGSNTTLAVINQFKLEAARSIRTSTIILSVFNTISALATALGIWYDCYSSAKRNRRPSQRVSAFTCVRGPETYPFVLSVGVVIQGIIFAVSQAQGLDGLFAKGCSLISQFMWPAIFIVPYLQLVFGAEVTIRAVRSKPFPPRGNWAVAICLAVFCLMLLATGLVAFFIRAANFCFASLFWFVTKWAEGGFVLFTLVSVVLAVCTVTVFIQLTRHATIETTERVIASRMVYFLGVALVSNVLMIPFFLALTMQMPGGGDSDMTQTLSMISTVVANISGLLNGGLHLFLRSNTIATIAPRDKQAEYERQKLKYKIGGPTPSEENFSNQINRPIDGPRILKRSPSEESFVLQDQALEEAAIESPPYTAYASHFDPPNPLRSHAVHPEPDPRAPEPAQLPSTQAPAGHARKPSASYSLFPNKPTANTNTESVALLLPTTYTPNDTANTGADMGANANPFSPAVEDFDDDLLKPPTIRGFGRHRRDSSTVSQVSMATVQIGLRFSNVNDMPPMDRTNESDRVNTLECPAPTRPSPLSKFAMRPEELSPARPSVFDNSQATLGGTAAALPQVPRNASLKEEVADEAAPADLFTLKPAVYSPNSPTKVKVPSPRGVGFNVPKRSNTNPSHRSPSPTPSPRTRGNSDAAAESKSDWI